MTPALTPGQITLVHRAAYWTRAPARGEVVCVDIGGELLVKRIVALPRETFELRRGRVYIDHQALDEPYATGGDLWTVPPSRLNRGVFLVMSDNRQGPMRHHTWGTVRRERIIGWVATGARRIPQPRTPADVRRAPSAGGQPREP